MSSRLALLLTLAFIFFLYRRDSKEENNVSGALWIPLVWFLITGSQFVSQWLSLLGVPMGATSPEDGSPIDRVIFFSLILAGLYVLYRRRVTISEFARNNVWLTLFLVYCFLAILWSDFQFVAFKRWIKILGHPIMALVVLTDPDPIEAVRRLIKRAAFVLVPMSILFIKYFPEYGRGFDLWTGEAFNKGVTLNKNELGYSCLIFGLFFFWNALNAFKIEDRKRKRSELLLSVGFFALVWWLLSRASSATSLASMVVGMAAITVVALPFINKRHMGSYLVAGVLLFVAAEMTFGIYAKVIALLGRNPTLTDRTDVWEVALQLQPDALFGAGFESFWMGERLEKLWSKYWWKPNQAHSGYIETYLNLGYVGVFILAALFIATLRKIRLDLLYRPDFGRLRLGFLFAILVYNYTEATFKGVHLLWTVFYLIAIDYPRWISSQGSQAAASDDREEEEMEVSTVSLVETEKPAAALAPISRDRHPVNPAFRFHIPSGSESATKQKPCEIRPLKDR
jgi:exopolysaccharide production protein ExoQ